MDAKLLIAGLILLIASIFGIYYLQHHVAESDVSQEEVTAMPAVAAIPSIETPSRTVTLPSPAGAQANSPSLSNTVNLPVEETYVHSKETSNATLLRAWGVPYQAGSPICQQAKSVGLRCWAMRGGLDELRQLDMPAALEMLSADGEKFYVTLLKLDQQTASFDIGNKVDMVSLAPLAYQWTGNYMILTRLPTEVRENISNGERSGSVEWLRKQLASLQGWSIGNEPAIFDEELKRRVQQFQLAQGLVPYGNAGPKTIMRLSAATDTSAPRLSTKATGKN